MTNDLQLFVKQGLEKGLSREKLAKALHEAGWPEDEVKTALESYADVDFPIAVPKRKPYLSAREAFMYLVMFLTLYISSISFGTDLFQFVNRWLPDAVEYPYIIESTTSIIRSATAALIITFPVFYWMSRVLRQAIARDPEKRSSKVRKWLTYLTLFVAAGVIIGDLITLVTYFLSGEITTRFMLKVVIVLAIAGSIFGYYLWDLRGEEKETPRNWKAYPAGFKAFVSIVLAAVSIVAISGLWIAGSPAAERARRFDERRTSELQAISYAIDNYWAINKSLPRNLETLQSTRDIYIGSIVDPESNAAYEYALTDSDTYSLCASFTTESVTTEPVNYNPSTSKFWQHSIGRTCYQIDVRKPTSPDAAPIMIK
ncbi:DUF5671 domain-containing protein [Candidatus Uhrbacteria bacterium]|nr:DUF5671 domain-containing protein [Candidatus Uhrbacteria bacterium]